MKKNTRTDNNLDTLIEKEFHRGKANDVRSKIVKKNKKAKSTGIDDIINCDSQRSTETGQNSEFVQVMHQRSNNESIDELLDAKPESAKSQKKRKPVRAQNRKKENIDDVIHVNPQTSKQKEESNFKSRTGVKPNTPFVSILYFIFVIILAVSVYHFLFSVKEEFSLINIASNLERDVKYYLKINNNLPKSLTVLSSFPKDAVEKLIKDWKTGNAKDEVNVFWVTSANSEYVIMVRKNKQLVTIRKGIPIIISTLEK